MLLLSFTYTFVTNLSPLWTNSMPLHEQCYCSHFLPFILWYIAVLSFIHSYNKSVNCCYYYFDQTTLFIRSNKSKYSQWFILSSFILSVILFLYVILNFLSISFTFSLGKNISFKAGLLMTNFLNYCLPDK